MNPKKRVTSAWFIGLGIILGSFSTAFAGNGFYFSELSVAGGGRALSGEVSIAGDASTAFYNPAGMTELHGGNFTTGALVVWGKGELEDLGSTTTVGDIDGGDGGNPVGTEIVPHAYLAYPIQERLYLGLAVNVPYALGTEYDPDWFGRYDSITSKLVVANISPSIAYAVNDALSLGLGIDVQFSTIEFESAVFTGGPDAVFEIKGDSTALGFNVGLLIKPRDKFSIGLHYRSRVKHDIEGDYEISLPTSILMKGTAEAEVNLPDILSIGFTYRLSNRASFLGQIIRFGWSSFDKVAIKDKQSQAVINETIHDYEDIFTVAVGWQYKANQNWTLRTGIRYEETPTVDEYRTTDVADADAWVLALGMDCRVTDNLSLNAAYTHYFLQPADIDINRDGLAPGLSTNTLATSKTQYNGIYFGLAYGF
jgi:long-chain fatty acid transport protein